MGFCFVVNLYCNSVLIFIRVCRKCFEPLLESLQPNEKGVRICPDDGDEITAGFFFQDNSAFKEILELQCFCVRKEDDCPWQGRVMDFEEHIAKCEYNIDGACPFEILGCDFKGSGREIREHIEKETLKHNTLIACGIWRVKSDVSTNKKKLNFIMDETERINDNYKDIKNDFQKLQAEAQKARDMFEERPNWLDENEQRLDAFNDKAVEVIQENQNKVKLHAEQLEELIKEVKETSEIGSYGGRVDNVSEKVRRLQETHKVNTNLMNTIDLKAKLYQATTFDGFFIWKLDNLRNRFTESVSGKVTELFTPPLYTSRHGYKFSAKLLLNGEKRDQRERKVPHIAFYIVLLQGDYDEILQFPFPHKIKITLINMEKHDRDIVHTLVPDDKVHYQKPFCDMNPAIGFSRFCSHDSLYSEGFVKGDAIYIKIEVLKERYKF